MYWTGSRYTKPLIGYNWGAKNIKRMKEAKKFSAIVGTIICCILTVVFYFAAGVILKLFIEDSEVISIGTQFLRIIIISVPVLGVQLILTNSFQAMPALLLSICRQGLVFIPSVMILNSVVGLTGIVIAQPVAHFVTVVLAVALYFKLSKEFPKENENSLDVDKSSEYVNA